MEVAKQFTSALEQRILPPFHQGLVDELAVGLHGEDWLGQRIRIYDAHDLLWHEVRHTRDILMIVIFTWFLHTFKY